MTAICKRMELNIILHHTQKINSKLIKDLDVRPQAIQSGKKTQVDSSMAQVFAKLFESDTRNKKKSKKDYFKLKGFCTELTTIN